MKRVLAWHWDIPPHHAHRLQNRMAERHVSFQSAHHRVLKDPLYFLLRYRFMCLFGWSCVQYYDRVNMSFNDMRQHWTKGSCCMTELPKNPVFDHNFVLIESTRLEQLMDAVQADNQWCSHLSWVSLAPWKRKLRRPVQWKLPVRIFVSCVKCCWLPVESSYRALQWRVWNGSEWLWVVVFHRSWHWHHWRSRSRLHPWLNFEFIQCSDFKGWLRDKRWTGDYHTETKWYKTNASWWWYWCWCN